MKIIYIGKYPVWHEYSYGGDEHIHKIAELMGKRGHDVYLINSIYNGEHLGVKYIKLSYVRTPMARQIEGIPFLLYPRYKEIIKCVHDIEPDIIHHFARFGFSVERAKKHNKIKTFTVSSAIVPGTTIRGQSYVPLLCKGKVNTVLGSMCFRYSFTRANRAIATSNALARRVSEECKTPFDDIIIIPRGVDTNKFKRQQWNNVDRNSILFVGRLEEGKGVRYIIDAMKYVLEKVPNAQLNIVGSGPEKEKFKKHAQEVAPNNIQFIGKISHNKIAEWYGKCNVFVMHSEFEPFGAVTIEAMASERPTVVSKTGGSIDIVRNGKTGFLVDFGDIKGMASGIVTVLENEELAKSMGEEGRKRVMANYMWEHEMIEIEKVYNGAFDAHKA